MTQSETNIEPSGITRLTRPALRNLATWALRYARRNRVKARRTQDEEERATPWFTRLWFFLIIVVGVLAIQWFAWSWIEGRFNSVGERAQFGDMFGGINTLFSGLAFATLIWTMLLQREELKLQRKELKDNREKLKKTADAQRAMLSVAKQEQRDREQKEHRAATLILGEWRETTHITLNPGTVTYTFSAENIGPNVSEIGFVDALPINIIESRLDVESALPTGKLITLHCDVDPNIACPHTDFIIDYTDINGNRRFQQYRMNWKSKVIYCSNFGYGPSEDPFSTSKNNRLYESPSIYVPRLPRPV